MSIVELKILEYRSRTVVLQAYRVGLIPHVFIIFTFLISDGFFFITDGVFTIMLCFPLAGVGLLNAEIIFDTN